MIFKGLFGSGSVSDAKNDNGAVSSRSSQTFKLKNRVRVCEMWTAECLDEVSEATQTPDRSFVMGWPTTNVVTTFSNSETKELWYNKLRE